MPRQSDLHFSFKSEGSTAFDVISFQLDEGISRPFRLTVDLSSTDPDVDFRKVLDQSATFTIWRGETAVRYVNGLVSRFEQGKAGFRRTYYRVVVEPQLSRADLRSDWRMFQQESVPQILQTVLKRSGINDAVQDLTKEHLVREYCVQPGETDFHFISRLCAEEGLFYTYRFSATEHRLIMGDRLYVHGTIEGGPVIYNATPSGDQAEPCITNLSYAEQVRTARQVQRDYSFKNPRYSHESRSDGVNLEHQGREYERYDYPSRAKRDEAGRPFTETRLLALRHDAQIAEIEGDDARLQPGLAFDLEGHAREDWNTGWRVVSMIHTGTQTVSQEEEAAEAEVGTQYGYTAHIVPDHIEWKPEPLPKPRIDGPLIATVTGPAGEEIYCDEFARVVVQFPWDRYGNNDEHSSCWIRVAQNWAGATWGHMAIPRIGQEVIVAFLDGDCDQPIIIGRTYHATNLPPYELPRHNIISTIRSKEHKGDRASELRIDDTQQQISAALMSDHGATALHLGYLTHPRPQGGNPRGEGFELRTGEHGSLRAAKGLLLTTDGQAKAQGGQLSRAELVQCLESALDLARNLGDYAGQHQNLPHDATPQQNLSDGVRELGYGTNDEREQGNGGQPLIALSSPAGIAAGTPKSITLAAGEHIDSVAQQNQQLTAGQKLVANAGQGIGMFAHGGELKQIAHQGDLTLQAQQATVRIEGKQSVELYATDNHILAVAGKELMLMCDGAYIKLQSGDIEIGCPGTLRFKAANYDMQGPVSQNADVPQFNVGNTQCRFVATLPDGQRAVPNQPYTITLKNGEVIKGVTDSQGGTQLLQKDAMHIAELALHPKTSQALTLPQSFGNCR
ncbi:Type VI secretion system spike protein VgrG2b [Paraburkholderia tropica]|uniref:type VI secretion system Vgr family protein n=1 Tax=Paraburkholderia tropica TaxID=92647 RepID=UPI001CAE85C1|nr:type VI secretion system tip protein VgrG [Paraburkholderia tropica]CAG9193601.1 Type VI secretion system spike protein VgrG2b [Paraburkholderia tropica]